MKFIFLLLATQLLLAALTHAIDPSDYEIKNYFLNNNIMRDNTTIELEAFSDKKLGKLNNRYTKGNNIYQLNFQGVIDEESKVGNFADLDGLKNGTKVTFGYSRLIFKGVGDAVKRAIDYCSETQFRQRFLEAETGMNSCRAKNKEGADKFPTQSEKDTFYRDACKKEQVVIDGLPKQCSSYKEFSRRADAEKYNDSGGISLHRFGLEMSAGNSNYKWLEGDALESRKDEKESYAMEIQYTYTNTNYQNFIFAYRYEDRWEAGNAKEICSPLSEASTSLLCQSIAITKPQNATSKILYFEWQSYLGNSASKAISVRITRDLDSDLTGIDIPVYLYQDEKSSGLQGGVRFGYLKNLSMIDTTKSDSETQFSLFFNKAFSIK